MKWLVFWFLMHSVQVSCPDKNPDPYTGEYSNFSCAVYHSKTIATFRHKCFETEEEAENFISKAPKDLRDKMHSVDISKDGVPKTYGQKGAE